MVPVRHISFVHVEILVLDFRVECSQLVVFVLEAVGECEGILELTKSEGIPHVEGGSAFGALDDGIDLVLVETSRNIGDLSVALLGEEFAVADLVRDLGELLLGRDHCDTESSGDLDRISTSEADVGLSQNKTITSSIDLVVVSQRIHFGITSEVHGLEAVESADLPANMRYSENMAHVSLQSGHIGVEWNILAVLGPVID